MSMSFGSSSAFIILIGICITKVISSPLYLSGLQYALKCYVLGDTILTKPTKPGVFNVKLCADGDRLAHEGDAFSDSLGRVIRDVLLEQTAIGITADLTWLYVIFVCRHHYIY